MWFVMKLMISAYDNTALGNISRLSMVNNGHNVFYHSYTTNNMNCFSLFCNENPSSIILNKLESIDF